MNVTADDGWIEMALIRKMSRLVMEKPRVHGEVECTYSVFEENGSKYLQLNTYGSPERKLAGKQSQTIQLSKESAASLKRLLEKEFS